MSALFLGGMSWLAGCVVRPSADLDTKGCWRGGWDILPWMNLSVAVAAAVLVGLHVVGGWLRFISYIPRSSWLSFAGGISVAYVFVHLLPEVARGERVVAEELGVISEAVWILGLLGLSVFYWVESLTRRSRTQLRGQLSSSPVAFWLSMASYGVYNSIIAYLLHQRAEEGGHNLALFVLAIGTHFLVNDFGLREHHKQRYRALGRWVLVAAIVLGAAAGAVGEVPEVVLVCLVAFIGGGVILNVFKEELPSEAESRLWAFLLGAGSYTGVLVAL